ncbi:MAG: N-acetylmuramoyl-L-alanine amidase [Verrucomicrobiales bacterium]|jgi:N-acetylmuramoyl-L-alanine amidase
MIRWSAIFFLGFAVATASAEPRFNTVVIDPGHGGMDSGAVWYGVQEKTLTLPVSKMLREQLLARGVKNVVMTREKDVIMGLSERAEFSNKHDRPIFVSMHFNANLTTSVTGIEIYAMPRSVDGKSLAESIGGPLEALGRRWLGVKTNNLKVLRATNHPAVVIEGGFLSNRGENWLIRTEKYQRKLTAAIAEGIVAWRDSRPPETVVAKIDPPKAQAPKLTPVPPEALPSPRPSPSPAPTPAPKPEPTAVAVTDFRVQFGAFSQQEFAATLKDDLKGKGIEVVILKRQGQTKVFHRVVSTRTFADANSADRWAQLLVREQGVKTTAVTR